jgi:hypothetical protein
MDEVSSFSNKLYSQNFMLDSKIILCDIFYEDSMNFLCVYPTIYTTGMCDATYIRVYDTSVHGKCFLSTLNNDTFCLTSTQPTLCVSLLSSHA